MVNEFQTVGSFVRFFTPSTGPDQYGVIVAKGSTELTVYGFADRKTYTLLGEVCLPFQNKDYLVMCERNYWQGLAVRLPGGKTCSVLNGEFDSEGPRYLRLEILLTDNRREHRYFSSVEITGHINATP
jgi:hypothetical protein